MSDRPCTCHPDDNPPVPCAKQYAYEECKKMIDNIQTEWQDLPDLQAVAKAQADGWEVQYKRNEKNDWFGWIENFWSGDHQFRGRPRQPTMKEVKMECWYVGAGLHWLERGVDTPHPAWIRQPHLDMIARVPE